MRLLSLDFDPVYGGKNTTRSYFSSDISAFDFDVVIWDPEATFDQYTSYSDTFEGKPSLSDDLSAQIKADVSRRKLEFKDFLEAGRSLVVIVRPPQKCYIATGEKQFSGTGRNRSTTRIVAPFDLWDALPLDSPNIQQARGNRLEIVGDGPIPTFLRSYKKLLSYAAVITDPPGVVLAKVTGTTRVASSVVTIASGGQLLLLPHPVLAVDDSEIDENEDDPERWVPEAPEFQAALLAALSEANGGREISRPPWADKYQTRGQKQLQVDYLKQRTRVESARKTMTATQKNLEDARSKDQLFLGTGRALETEVKVVLELMGGTVTDPEPGRDDWKVSFPEGNAVVEVKGVSNSAAEKQAAQLEKWVATEMEATGSAPKGLLVVNTYRERPLSERTDPDFPSQMLPYCKGRKHCLITGLQLFVIREEIEKDKTKAKFWRAKILRTSGTLTDVPDWRTVISEVKTSK